MLTTMRSGYLNCSVFRPYTPRLSIYRLEFENKGRTAYSILGSATVVGYLDHIWDCGDNG